QFEREAQAYWDRMPKVSDADRQVFDERYIFPQPARGAVSAPSKPAPGRSAATAEKGDSTKQQALGYIADKYYPSGRPQRGSAPMRWRNFADNCIAPYWDKACDALGLPPSRRPQPAGSRTVSRFFQQRSTRG